MSRLNITFKRIISVVMLLTVVLSFTFAVQAKENKPKVVRVGWFDSSYNSLDERGRRSGYSYEYQLKISAYNGWTYEYVEGSWSDLFQMLIDGEIDLMSDISYTEERSKLMLYPTLPMGTEEYYLFVAAGKSGIKNNDYSSLKGKKVGVNKDSYQEILYTNWAKENNIEAEQIEVTSTEDESLEMLESGELDAYVTVDSFMDPSRAVPMFKIGSSDYYFAVNKNRPDLLDDLNMAMSKIQDEDRFYNQKMFEKYIRTAGANAFFTDVESQWLEKNETIRVGYQDNYMAFCAEDKKTGELTGVLKDYLEIAENSIPNAHISFETVSYPTVEAAIKALKNGKIDCVFPANLNGYEAETQGIVTTPALMTTEMYAVVLSANPDIFSKEEPITVAVNKGNINYDAFVAERYPNWKKSYFKDTKECLKAISTNKADCLIISNYRLNNLSRICDNYHLTEISIGKSMDYCFAVAKGNTELYSILSKTTSMVPESVINAALTQYITQDAKLTLIDVLEDNMPIVLAVISGTGIIILILLIMTLRTVKKSKQLILATETDDLTGLYNRKYFFEYADIMYHEHPLKHKDAIVLNIEQFHSINELHGREVGDDILRVLGNEIREVTNELGGIAGRFEADRFDIYCNHTDDYEGIFNRLQSKLDQISPNTNIRLRMGVMPWQDKLEPVQLFDRARTACNMARGHYSEHMIVYDKKVANREQYEQRLVNDLRNAIETKQFEIYYQPKYDIQSNPEKIVSAEALVRWNHPEFGRIPPNDFIPLFENNGLIKLLDKYVWSEVGRKMAQWREKYGVIIPISVNVSRVDVFDPRLCETLEEILETNNLDHNSFMLEVTESAYTEDADKVIPVLEGLRDMGYKFEMDDFGTGYSSLSMLSEMPIDGLKMDGAFIRNIEYDPKELQMVALILDIAKNLNVPVIAEGVETEKQLKKLKELGCEKVQGFYFSKPIPSDEFEKKYFEN